MGRFKPAAMVAALLLLMHQSQASEWIDQGRVAIRGTIHQSACSIRTEDTEQTIVMGVLPLARLLRDGKGPDYSFSIQLMNCQDIRNSEESATRFFSIGFDSESQPGRPGFAVQGEASGVELMIADAQGRTITPGALHRIDEHLTPQYGLRYRLFLVRNQQRLRSGNYAAAIRFHLNYN